MVTQQVRFFQMRIPYTMVWSEYDYQILPLWRLFQSIDKFPDTVVKITERIIHFIIETVIRYRPRFMTAQCEKSRMPMFFLMTDHLMIQVIKRNIIPYAPFAASFGRFVEILKTLYLLILGSYDIRTHVGKIDVSSVKEVCRIPVLHQFTGDRRQIAALGR